MSGDFDQESMMKQAQNIWTMLDEMAENDPASYRKFINQKTKEGKEYMQPPEPHMCVETLMLVGNLNPICQGADRVRGRWGMRGEGEVKGREEEEEGEEGVGGGRRGDERRERREKEGGREKEEKFACALCVPLQKGRRETRGWEGGDANPHVCRNSNAGR